MFWYCPSTSISFLIVICSNKLVESATVIERALIVYLGIFILGLVMHVVIEIDGLGILIRILIVLSERDYATLGKVLCIILISTLKQWRFFLMEGIYVRS